VRGPSSSCSRKKTGGGRRTTGGGGPTGCVGVTRVAGKAVGRCVVSYPGPQLLTLSFFPVVHRRGEPTRSSDSIDICIKVYIWILRLFYGRIIILSHISITNSRVGSYRISALTPDPAPVPILFSEFLSMQRLDHRP
jgi:hypothetical protein